LRTVVSQAKEMVGLNVVGADWQGAQRTPVVWIAKVYVSLSVRAIAAPVDIRRVIGIAPEFDMRYADGCAFHADAGRPVEVVFTSRTALARGLIGLALVAKRQRAIDPNQQAFIHVGEA